MLEPFDINTRDLAYAFQLRLSNPLVDLPFVEAENIIYLLDAFFLYCRFLGDLEQDIKGHCAEAIYNSGPLQFAVLPETLWEIRSGIESVAERLIAQNHFSELKAFAMSAPISRFVALMKVGVQKKRSEIYTLIGQLFSDNASRRKISALFRYEALRSFETPLRVLREDLGKGKLLRVSDLCRQLGAKELGFKEADRKRAYAVLSSWRANPRSDSIDALVYARCSLLNHVAIESGSQRRCRFLSHESMLDMLQSLDGARSEPLVRSFTDSLISLSLVEGTISRDELRRLSREAAELIKLSGCGWGSSKEVVRFQGFRSRLRDLRDRVLPKAAGGSIVPRVAFSEMAARRYGQFFSAVERLRNASDHPETVRDQLREGLDELYRAINNVRRVDGSLEEFMQPMLRASWDVWSVAQEDPGTLDVVLELLSCASSSQEVRFLVEEMQRNRLDFGEAVRRVRAKLRATPATKLTFAAEFLQLVERMYARQRTSVRRHLQDRLTELEMFVNEFAEGKEERATNILEIVRSDSRAEVSDFVVKLVTEALEERAERREQMAHLLMLIEGTRVAVRDV